LPPIQEKLDEIIPTIPNQEAIQKSIEELTGRITAGGGKPEDFVIYQPPAEMTPPAPTPAAAPVIKPTVTVGAKPPLAPPSMVRPSTLVSQPPKPSVEEKLSLSLGASDFAAVDPIRPTEFTPAPKQETPTERKIRLSQEAIAAGASKPAGGISDLFKGPKPVISKPTIPAPRPIISRPVAPIQSRPVSPIVSQPPKISIPVAPKPSIPVAPSLPRPSIPIIPKLPTAPRMPIPTKPSLPIRPMGRFAGGGLVDMIQMRLNRMR